MFFGVNDPHSNLLLTSVLPKKIANLISSKSNLVLAIGKEAFYKQLEQPMKQAYTYASKIMTENMMKKDAIEGINSFIEKRSPVWKNK